MSSPDRAGLEARFPDGVIPPGTRVRRSPGDPSCEACLDSPIGFCREHPEFSFEPGPEPAAPDGDYDEVHVAGGHADDPDDPDDPDYPAGPGRL